MKYADKLLTDDVLDKPPTRAGEISSIVLDQRGARCPVPVLALKRALRACATGQIVELLATDPDSARDIPRFVEASSLTLVSSAESGGEFRFRVRK